MSRRVLDTYEQDEQRGVAAEVVWYAFLSVITFLLLVAAVSASAAFIPGYCAMCHGSFAAGLKTQAHKDVNCDQCHGAADGFGLIDKRLTGVSMVYSKFIPGVQVVSSQTDDQLCLLCHEKDVQGVIESQGLRMSHKEVTAVRMGCGTCHVPSAHPQQQTYTIGYSMDKCMQCHESNPNNPDTCVMCHVGAAPDERQARTSNSWRLVHGTEWQKTHGLGDVSGCGSCHADRFCAKCHGVKIPHPPDFPGTHGQVVKRRPKGEKECLTCHELTACYECHGVSMPHPASFQKEHKETVKRIGMTVCWRCHSKEACESCHESHQHPGFDVKQPSLEPTKPVSAP